MFWGQMDLMFYNAAFGWEYGFIFIVLLFEMTFTLLQVRLLWPRGRNRVRFVQ